MYFIKQSQNSKKFRENQWDDFHFNLKNENRDSKKVTKNANLNRSVILIQFKKRTQIFQGYILDLIYFISYNKV